MTRYQHAGYDPASRAYHLVRTTAGVTAVAVAAAIVILALHLSRANGASPVRPSPVRASAARRRAPGAAEPRRARAPGTSSLRVTSLSPGPNATAVAPNAAVDVGFSAPLAGNSPMPSISPSLAGSWHRVGASALQFLPTTPAMPLAAETITIPAGSGGMRGADGAELASVVTEHWQVRNGSILRLQQVLAELGYLPLTWTRTPANPSIAAGANAAGGNTALEELYQPPTGSFAWRYPNTPAQLRTAWQVGVDNHMTTGAMVAFERHDGLPAYTSLRPQMWSALLTAEAHGTTNPEGYTYALVSQARPESLSLWHDGRIVYTSVANTGIAQTPTQPGTFFIYQRFASTTMQGDNPNGQYYVDHGVRWVNYFNGGDAIHGFVRASYGFPQSLGCVELPVSHAAIAWRWLHYGTVVTVLPEPGATAS